MLIVGYDKETNSANGHTMKFWIVCKSVGFGWERMVLFAFVVVAIHRKDLLACGAYSPAKALLWAALFWANT